MTVLIIKYKITKMYGTCREVDFERTKTWLSHTDTNI